MSVAPEALAPAAMLGAARQPACCACRALRTCGGRAQHPAERDAAPLLRIEVSHDRRHARHHEREARAGQRRERQRLPVVGRAVSAAGPRAAAALGWGALAANRACG
jgi:hypothetical protein